jgi:predicted O-linked N-acetylglucosamine transferase (SPINDLY family)
MGVPVMTLEGSAHASRVGVSLLNNVNLPDWIASREDDYITKAVHHARRTKLLSALRQDLRNRMQNSPLTQSDRYVRALESAYKRMLSF